MDQQGWPASPYHKLGIQCDICHYTSAIFKAQIASTTIGGDVANGEQLFGSVCAPCHGEDGREINFGSEDEPEYLGTLAADNPWEFIHKVRVGQPGTAMPSALDSGWSMQQVVDVLTFSQTLPTEAP